LKKATPVNVIIGLDDLIKKKKSSNAEKYLYACVSSMGEYPEIVGVYFIRCKTIICKRKNRMIHYDK